MTTGSRVLAAVVAVLASFQPNVVHARQVDSSAAVQQFDQFKGVFPGGPASLAYESMVGSAANALGSFARGCEQLEAADQLLNFAKRNLDGYNLALFTETTQFYAHSERSTPPNVASLSACDNPDLPLNKELRGVLPLVDPAAGTTAGGLSGKDLNVKTSTIFQQAISGTLDVTPALGKSVRQLLQGFGFADLAADPVAPAPVSPVFTQPAPEAPVFQTSAPVEPELPRTESPSELGSKGEEAQLDFNSLTADDILALLTGSDSSSAKESSVSTDSPQTPVAQPAVASVQLVDSDTVQSSSVTDPVEEPASETVPEPSAEQVQQPAAPAATSTSGVPECSAVLAQPLQDVACTPSKGAAVGVPSAANVNTFCFSSGSGAAPIQVCKNSGDATRVLAVAGGSEDFSSTNSACEHSCNVVGKAKCSEKGGATCDTDAQECLAFCKATINTGILMEIVPNSIGN